MITLQAACNCTGTFAGMPRTRTVEVIAMRLGRLAMPFNFYVRNK